MYADRIRSSPGERIASPPVVWMQRNVTTLSVRWLNPSLAFLIFHDMNIWVNEKLHRGRIGQATGRGRNTDRNRERLSFKIRDSLGSWSFFATALLVKSFIHSRLQSFIELLREKNRKDQSTGQVLRKIVNSHAFFFFNKSNRKGMNSLQDTKMSDDNELLAHALTKKKKKKRIILNWEVNNSSLDSAIDFVVNLSLDQRPRTHDWRVDAAVWAARTAGSSPRTPIWICFCESSPGCSNRVATIPLRCRWS